MIRRSGRHKPLCDCCNGETTEWASMVATKVGDQLLCEACRDKKKHCCLDQERTMGIWRRVYERMENREVWWHKVAPTLLFMEEEALVGAN